VAEGLPELKPLHSSQASIYEASYWK